MLSRTSLASLERLAMTSLSRMAVCMRRTDNDRLRDGHRKREEGDLVSGGHREVTGSPRRHYLVFWVLGHAGPSIHAVPGARGGRVLTADGPAGGIHSGSLTISTTSTAASMRRWYRKVPPSGRMLTLCCRSRKGRSISMPPSWTIHHTSMLPSVKRSPLDG
ncbi:hypothetical protein EYF80_041053 [Liparis tanakae]|uniref:Uncharacterized protein n=1 Tax=Liparis tanakae TaxID=230148 RepID=A0A4Z2G5E4_9TELE|nr:hypothetical protein EYF80_041053 [Liparis tanakae]